MFVYGRNSIEEALEEGIKLKEVFIEIGKEEKFSNLAIRLHDAGVAVKFVNEGVIAKLSQSLKHQGITAEMPLPPCVREKTPEDIDWSQYNLILALDGITDTGNLGAIVRSALLFGAGAIVLPNDASARITPQTIRSSAGAVYKQDIYYVNSLNTFIETVLAEDFGVYGLTGEATQNIQDTNFSEKVCFVIGSEREGIRKSVKRKCTELIKIPTTKKLDSLNASVASAVAMWEVYRGRK